MDHTFHRIDEASGVHLLGVFPPQEVPDHQVLLSFNHDSDALLFREWLQAEGLTLFSNWRDEQT